MRPSIRWQFCLCIAIVATGHAVLTSIVVDRLAAGAVVRTPPSRPPLQLVVVGQASGSVKVASADPVTRTIARDRGTDVESIAAPAPKVPSAEGVDGFLSPRELDVVARPRSAPDISMLEGLPWSGVPMRLRLFIAATGTVVDAVVLHASDDEEVVQRVRKMFLATAFVAGRTNGVDVASYKDIEIAVGTRSRDVRQVACAQPDCLPSR